MSEDNKFNYSYKAPTKNEREQIEDIRKQYTPKSHEETKFETLKKLDRKVKTTPQILSITLGIIGTLIFGLGLTLVLEWKQIVFGIITMAIGLIPMLLAYPIYKSTLRKMKNKYGSRILELSDELLNK